MLTAMSDNIPRLGETAPDFTAETTHGVIQFSKWQGDSWVVLFSHPADFTPVCATEIAALARRAGDFHARNTQLLGLSIDSIHSHLAWLQNLRDRLGVVVPFPLIADVDMRVARQYGMLHPEASSTATVRAVFFIDPERKVRALLYYPLSSGRNVDEMLRLLDSLQLTSKHSVSTPVDWRPGDKVIVPPPRNVEALEQRLRRTDVEHVDFYLGYQKP